MRWAARYQHPDCPRKNGSGTDPGVATVSRCEHHCIVATAPTTSASPSPTPAPSVTPTPSAPTPTDAATDAPTSTPPADQAGPTVNGFDAREVYRMCIAATPEITGFGHTLTLEDYVDGSVTPGVDPYTKDGLPESEWESVATVVVN